MKDQIIALQGKHKGVKMRCVEAREEVDDTWHKMVFITNNMEWSPSSVCDLYRRRWDIEVFFKQVKQSLKIGSFLGHSANAVRCQVYTALLVYLLLRFIAHLSVWGHSFTRLFTALGAVGANRLIGITEILWNSIRAVQGDRRTQYRMVSRVYASKT